MPETRELGDRICAESAGVRPDDHLRAIDKVVLQGMAEGLLNRMGLGEQYLGFTMVAITNEFWREHVSSIDFNAAYYCCPTA